MKATGSRKKKPYDSIVLAYRENNPSKNRMVATTVVENKFEPTTYSKRTLIPLKPKAQILNR